MDLKQAQSRIDDIRLLQALNQHRVVKLTTKIARTRNHNPEECEKAQSLLIKADEKYVSFLDELNTLERLINAERAKTEARETRQNQIRQIACALLTNPDRIEGSQEALIEEATEINDLILTIA